MDISKVTKKAKLIKPEADTEAEPKPKAKPKAKTEPKSESPPKVEIKEKAEPKVKAEPKAKAEKPQVIVQQVKVKRAPSAYNNYISEQTKGGKMSFTDAVQSWKNKSA